MADSGPSGDDEGRYDEGLFDEVAEAAEAVLASLKWLIEATQRAIQDPQAMTAVAATGKSFLDAFTRGFQFNDFDGDTESPQNAESTTDAEPVEDSATAGQGQ